MKVVWSKEFNPKRKRPKEAYAFKPFRFLYGITQRDCTDGDNELKPRSGHRIVCIGNFIYCFGGYNPTLTKEEYLDPKWQETNPLFQELWQFNVLSGVWKRIECNGTVPDELASHAAVSFGPFMLIYGGTAVPFSATISNKLYVCNTVTAEWKILSTNGIAPEPMYGQGVYLDKENKILYTVGGTTGFEYRIDVSAISLNNYIWETLNPRSSTIQVASRYRHEVVKYEDNLLVFGGGEQGVTYSLRRVPAFNLANRYWSKIPTTAKGNVFPEKRKCHVLVTHKQYAYIHGGCKDEENQVVSLKDFWRINLQNMEWEQVHSFSYMPLYFHSATKTEEGCMYIFGGIKNVNRNQRSSTIIKVWLEIPRLRTICWEAIGHYAPHLPFLPSDVLIASGIPMFIVQSLHPVCPAFG